MRHFLTLILTVQIAYSRVPFLETPGRENISPLQAAQHTGLSTKPFSLSVQAKVRRTLSALKTPAKNYLALLMWPSLTWRYSVMRGLTRWYGFKMDSSVSRTADRLEIHPPLFSNQRDISARMAAIRIVVFLFPFLMTVIPVLILNEFFTWSIHGFTLMFLMFPWFPSFLLLIVVDTHRFAFYGIGDTAEVVAIARRGLSKVMPPDHPSFFIRNPLFVPPHPISGAWPIQAQREFEHAFYLRPGSSDIDYPRAMEDLLTRLSEDFEWGKDTVENARQKWKKITETAEPVGRDEVQQLLDGSFYLSHAELSPKESFRLEPYVTLLGVLFSSPDLSSAEVARPYIDNLNRCYFSRESVAPGQLKIAPSEVAGFQRSDDSIAGYPKEIIRRRSLFRSHYSEKPLAECTDSEIRRRIDAAFLEIDEWAKQPFSPGDSDLEDFHRHIHEVKDQLSIVLIKSPLPFLFLDLTNFLIRPMGTGRSRSVIYFTQAFLESFDPNNPEDNKLLATFLLHRMEWFYIQKKLLTKKNTSEQWTQKMETYTNRLFEGNRYHLLTENEPLRSHLFLLTKHQITEETVHLVPFLLAEYRNFVKKIAETREQHPHYDDWETADRESREQVFGLAQMAESIGRHVHVLGNLPVSRWFMSLRLRYYRLFQKNEEGELPITIQRNVVIWCLREMDLRGFLANLDRYLNSKFQFRVDLTEDERETQRLYARNTISMSLPPLRAEIIRLASSRKESGGVWSPDDLNCAVKKGLEMIDAFLAAHNSA